MAYPEDLFSALTRFERFLTVNGVDRYRWVAALEFLLSGRHLDTYLANVDSFMGDYVGLKRVLLDSGGFSFNDCIDSIHNPYRQHRGMSATTWVRQNSYKIYTILRQNSENKDINCDRLLKLAESLASSLVLHPLSREGRAFIFSNNPKTPNERIQLYEDYMSPFSSLLQITFIVMSVTIVVKMTDLHTPSIPTNQIILFFTFPSPIYKLFSPSFLWSVLHLSNATQTQSLKNSGRSLNTFLRVRVV